MCGIAGIINYRDGLASSGNDLAKMMGSIHHRGPDDSNVSISDNNHLGHTRLSIIDLSGGRQPIFNSDKSVTIVFNGEIFNYIELKDRYLKGYPFYTSSDTEVIVALYEKFGIDFIQYLNGQFSIALYDSRLQRTYIIRDRVGICPLFYSCVGNTLYFASEIKALLQASETNTGLNLSGFSDFIHLWAPLSPETLFEGIYEVSPGYYLEVSDQGVDQHCYWDFNYQPGALDISLEDAVMQLDELLQDAVSIRLRSDVPVGAYLSGGLDSSIILSYLSAKRHDLSTFSLTFSDEELNEERYQKEVSDYFSTRHYSVRADNYSIAENFKECIHFTESPLFRTAPVPMMLLSKKVHEQGYKVVLTGEGSDEVFGGYDIFKEARIREFWSRFPDSECRPNLFKKIYPYLELSKIRSTDYLKQAFGHNLTKTDHLLYAFYTRASTTSAVYDFLVDDIRSEIDRDIESRARANLDIVPGQFDVFNTAQYVESRTIMAGYILSSQGDRMLMANSVEGRFPFLDHRVIEFAGKLKNRFKLNGLNEKFILKQMAKARIPQSVLNRPKQPYRAPDINALLCSRDNHLLDYMTEQQINKNNLFDSKRVNMLLKKVKAGRARSVKDN
ncbi:MAG: asparagine synthase (glutamine-hydrolyzing), partial [Gammaproteobacteria bacterium]|nr:asparagine synthase (glutamine-hydrolyzing) [Gammaproteobacteria bacterium]